MADDLGGRLARVGLVTRDDLAEIVATAPAHDAALVRALVRRGISEDAIAGFFLSEGFGPLLSRGDLGRADNLWASRLPARMALDFLAVPVRAATDGIVVAMAAPSDDHLVRELSRLLGQRTIATVARASDIEACVRAAHPDVVSEEPKRMESEPPVLELTRRRSSPGFDGGFRAPDRDRKDAKLGPRLALPDDEPAMPLVRHKPSHAPPGGVKLSERPADVVVVKTFANPDTQRTPWVRPSDPLAHTAEYRRPTSISPSETARSTETRKTTASMMKAVDPQVASATVVETPPSEPPIVSMAPALEARGSSEPVAPEERWDLPSAPLAPAGQPGAQPRARDGTANKLGARAAGELPTLKATAGEIGTVLAAIRSAEDRDQVVKLACEGAVSVARTAVFFALRKGVLKGWDGAGPGIRRDSVRNLWIPTSSPSTFKKVLDTGQGHVGPYGTSIADGLFRAAVGSRGGDLMIQPVIVGGKAVGCLCADDVRPGPIGAHRIEVLAQGVADAFVRIISAGKE